MTTTVAITPKHKRRAGEPCACPPVAPSLDHAGVQRLVALAKALADPVRVGLVDVLRDHPGTVCPCELAPLFALSQPTISHHLKVLKDAGILGSEKHGLFTYYYVQPGALDDLTAWLTR